MPSADLSGRSVWSLSKVSIQNGKPKTPKSWWKKLLAGWTWSATCYKKAVCSTKSPFIMINHSLNPIHVKLGTSGRLILTNIWYFTLAGILNLVSFFSHMGRQSNEQHTLYSCPHLFKDWQRNLLFYFKQIYMAKNYGRIRVYGEFCFMTHWQMRYKVM